MGLDRSACDIRKERNDPVTRNARAVPPSATPGSCCRGPAGGDLRSPRIRVARKQTRRTLRHGKKVGGQAQSPSRRGYGPEIVGAKPSDFPAD